MTTAWSVGDACVVRGHKGVVESLGPACASVKINEWRRIFAGLDELEPMPKASEESKSEEVTLGAAVEKTGLDREVESAAHDEQISRALAEGAPPPLSAAPDFVDVASAPVESTKPLAAVPVMCATTLPAPLDEESFPDGVAEGEKGSARLRKDGDPLKKHGTMRRPRPEDIERWFDYRTHVCVAHNKAVETNAPTEVIEHFRKEHEFATAFLEQQRPGFTERLHHGGKAKAKRTRKAKDAVTPQEHGGTIAGPSEDDIDVYTSFVATKLTSSPATGLATVPALRVPMFDFQRDLVSWALRRGRSALFADTGLGKTRMILQWSHAVAEHTGGRVLVLAPLAVGAQTVREAELIGVGARQVRYGSDVDVAEERIVVTNYDRLHHFDPAAFTAVVCDESSVIKSHDSKTFTRLTEAFAATPFKLCASATPSPNDYTELGTHAEFLGVCSRTEMLAEYFIHDGGDTSKWRLKGHARRAFWRWVSTWAAMVRKPSDLGYANEGYDLPELRITQHTIPADPQQVKEQGLLFAEPAMTLTERRQARKGTINERVRRCAAKVLSEPSEAWVVWCELNAESAALADAIPGAVEIRGADDAILKESRLVAFANGEIRVLISKPSMTGHGLNWQHAARMAFVGVSDSFEQTYQAIRREWRFGQKRPVEVHFFASELEGAVVENLRRKERDALAMAEQLTAETRDAVRAEVLGQKRVTNDYAAVKALTRPAWLHRESAA